MFSRVISSRNSQVFQTPLRRSFSTSQAMFGRKTLRWSIPVRLNEELPFDKTKEAAAIQNFSVISQEERSRRQLIGLVSGLATAASFWVLYVGEYPITYRLWLAVPVSMAVINWENWRKGTCGIGLSGNWDPDGCGIRKIEDQAFRERVISYHNTFFLTRGLAIVAIVALFYYL